MTTTEEEFQEALRELVREAASNGVDVRGGWIASEADGEATFDIEITRIVPRPEVAEGDTKSS